MITFSPLGPWKFSPMFPCWRKQISTVPLINNNKKLSVSEHFAIKEIEFTESQNKVLAQIISVCSFHQNGPNVRVVSVLICQCFNSPLVQGDQEDLVDPGRQHQKTMSLGY